MHGKVFLTGGSGLLGRQVRLALGRAGWDVVAPTHAALDLTEGAQVRECLASAAPDVIVNCAAQRHPDRCESADPQVVALNVALPAQLGTLGIPLLHISTDYVFDGTTPPYEVDAPRCPINAYGRQKAEAETALDGLPHALTLRVPILFGPTDDWRASAVTVLAANLVAARGAAVPMDDLAIRYPTFTPDVARQIVRLLPALRDGLAGIVHYSGEEPLTKFLMALTMAPMVGCEATQCLPERTPPTVPRPHDCHLSVRRLQGLGLYERPTPFATALLRTL